MLKIHYEDQCVAIGLPSAKFIMEQVPEGCTQKQFAHKDKSGKTFTPLWLASLVKKFCL